MLDNLEQRQVQNSDLLDVRVAFADYDRTRPLIDGRVKLAGLAPSFITEYIGNFCSRPVYEEFDLAEMSLSWFVAARMRGDAVRGIPIFPLRMAVLGYVFCHTDSPFTHPRDLAGKRVATMGYRYTVNLWLRGILEEYYGLSADRLTWVTSEVESAGYTIPSNIDFEIDTTATADELLERRQVDAVFTPVVPPAFERGEGWIRRLFADAASEHSNLYAKTDIFPITHVMVGRKTFVQQNPWVIDSLIDGFEAAQDLVDLDFREPKYSSLPDALFLHEESKRRYPGWNSRHGIEPNRAVLEKFIQYAREQGYIDSSPQVEDLFAL